MASKRKFNSEEMNESESQTKSNDANNMAPYPPHFLIIGVQKSGTMSAVLNLNKHKDISVLSELHYFDLGWNSKTPEQYISNFTKQNHSNKLLLGEKTPELIYVDICASRIKEICHPQTKFILFLR